jgi:preprotein translocase subunit YajC
MDTSTILAQGFGGGGAFDLLVPLVVMFAIMYFLIIRPQRQQAKKREEMLKAIRRNDGVVTGGGIVGKVTKVIDDNEVEVEIAKDVRVKIMRSMISNVMVKGAPVAANDTSGKKSPAKKK